MRTQIPYQRVLAVAICGVLAVALFIFLNNSFGGPTLPPSSPYELRASFPDSQNLVKKSLVMIRGVKVGEVTDVKVVDGRARVAFTVFDKYRPVRQGATASVGHRTIFGEAIVNLTRGRRGGAELDDGTELRDTPTVQPDEALRLLGPRTRRNLTRGLRGLNRALASPRAAERLSATYTGLWETVGRLHDLTDALRGQEKEIASLVSSSATVTGVLGSREADLRRIVGAARTVTETWADQSAAVGAGVDELHALLGQGRETLAAARPLSLQLERVARGIRAPARDLRPAFDGVRPIVRDARLIVDALEPANRYAKPALDGAGKLFSDLIPLTRQLAPTLGNLVPLFRYIAQHRARFAAFIGNIADSVDNGDSTGNWLHGFLILDPKAGLSTSQGCESDFGICSNAYPSPDDPIHLRRYEKGTYDRLQPYMP